VGVLLTRRDPSDSSGCYSVLDVKEGLVDCVQSWKPSLNSHVRRDRLALTRIHRDRSRYPGQINRHISSTTHRPSQGG